MHQFDNKNFADITATVFRGEKAQGDCGTISSYNSTLDEFHQTYTLYCDNRFDRTLYGYIGILLYFRANTGNSE